jgi:hypothetical protein
MFLIFLLSNIICKYCNSECSMEMQNLVNYLAQNLCKIKFSSFSDVNVIQLLSHVKIYLLVEILS